MEPHPEPIQAVAPGAPTREALMSFTVRLAWALHRYGAPAHRLEEVLQLMSDRLRIPGQFFAMPTALLASFGTLDKQHTMLVRVEPGDVDLQKQVKLDDIAERVADGRLDPRVGVEEIDAVVRAPARYGVFLTVLCFGIASGAASRFFGGGWREVLVSSITGLTVGALAQLMGRRTSTSRLYEPVAAVVASLFAALGAWWLGPLSTSMAVLGGLIVLVPGLTVTTALNELATRHLMSGTGRLMGAMMVFLVMGLGVTLGTKLARLVPGVAQETIALPFWTEGVALCLGLLAFAVLFRVPTREIPWTFVIGAVVYATARFGSHWLGPDLAVGTAAFLLGTLANLYARVRRRPAAIPLVPSLMLLVPGSVGFRSLLSLLEKNVLSGVETAFQMIMVGVSLVTGLLLANLVLPPRRAL
jgi:uncharacterized membrane protein YjjP (DUF1212 family)